MKIICKLGWTSESNFFPKNFLLEGKIGYNVHRQTQVKINEELEIDADIKGNIPFHPGIDGTEFEMFLEGNVSQFDLISFDDGNHNEIMIYVEEIFE